MTSPPRNVLIMGGAGYIGSHVALELLQQGIQTAIADNLSMSDEATVAAVRQFGGDRLRFMKTDMLSRRQLSELYNSTKPDVTIHLAGLKQVAESFEKPGKYRRTNVGGLVNVLEAMNESGCRRIIFSSSASVYGSPRYLPIDEEHPTAPLSPYGETKLACEDLLRKWRESGRGRHATILRYFNPVGHNPLLETSRPSCSIQQMPLAEAIRQVASADLHYLEIFGADYQTPDGTCMRDFVHIGDIARAHLDALKLPHDASQLIVLNLGSGKGTTLLELVAAFEAVNGIRIPLKFLPRRQGDVPKAWADISRAKSIMNWLPHYGREEICRVIGQALGNKTTNPRLDHGQLVSMMAASDRRQPHSANR